MRPFAYQITTLLMRREHGATIRHPLIVFCHLPFALLLTLVWMFLSDWTVGQTLYFASTVWLYFTSAAYHTWRPSWQLRFFDQTAISWYVLVTPIPFIYHEWWALPMFFSLAFISTLNKWYEWEPNWQTGTWCFLGLGVLSTTLLFTSGMSALGVGLWSIEAGVATTAILLFVLKLLIYSFEGPVLIRGYWEAPELGHFVLALGVVTYTYLVVMYPV